MVQLSKAVTGDHSRRHFLRLSVVSLKEKEQSCPQSSE